MNVSLSLGRLGLRKWKWVVRNKRGERRVSLLFPSGHYIELAYNR
ncbi:hypothetical protein [Halospeciosus flavus]|uniref:Uncharacterized protein n=1 Tax=Halospeciosus flavus TaxID=3032283 RepID=A0ABD5Z2X2_9EURY|nr:hypothetical protein [Halospeciosus flavus]